MMSFFLFFACLGVVAHRGFTIFLTLGHRKGCWRGIPEKCCKDRQDSAEKKSAECREECGKQCSAPARCKQQHCFPGTPLILSTVAGSPCSTFHLGGRFGYFLFFLLRKGQGGVRGTGRGGCRFNLKIPGGGGGLQEGEGPTGPGGCLRRIGELRGSGLIFFSGPKRRPSHQGQPNHNQSFPKKIFI